MTTTSDQAPVQTMESWSDRLDLEALGRAHGTPLYIFEPAQLESNFAAYAALAGDAGNVRYPVKANPSLEILHRIAELGGGADCANDFEVWLARSAGIPVERIVYYTPAPDVDLSIELLRAGAAVVADSVQHLDALERRGCRSGRILARVLPDLDIAYHRPHARQELFSHSGRHSRLGIEPVELLAWGRRAKLALGGLHLHPGSRLDHLQPFLDCLDHLHDLAEQLDGLGHEVRVLDLGGGLGSPHLVTDLYPRVETLAAALRPRLRGGREYWMEPGNSLVGDTVGLLAAVVVVKPRREGRWAILDVGSDQLRHAERSYQLVDQRHRTLPREGPDAVGGPLCFAGDVLLPSTELGPIQAGDHVLVQHCGAYCFSTSTHFNGRQYGGMVSLDGDRVVRTHRRESFLHHPSVATFDRGGRPPTM